MFAAVTLQKPEPGYIDADNSGKTDGARLLRAIAEHSTLMQIL